MNRITIVYKPDEKCLNICRELTMLFRNYGFDVKTHSVDDVFTEKDREADLVVSIGGDGTLLRISRVYQHYTPLILPIPCGRRTVLYEDIEPNEYSNVVNRVVNGLYTIELLKRLKITVDSNNYMFLNEVLLISSDRGRVTGFEITVKTINYTSVVRFEGDGVIIGPSIGSAAYNLSTRGSLIDSSIDAVFITPLNPVELNILPVIVPYFSKIMVSSRGYTELYVDGEETVFLKPNTVSVIEPSIFNLRVIRLFNRDLLKKVFSKRRLVFD
ncbi:MAG: NAD(+)/NADH kinase [Desulfurococcaceae archaeon]